MKSEAVLIKSALDQEVEPATNWQELAIESMEEPGLWIERGSGSSREGLGWDG